MIWYEMQWFNMKCNDLLWKALIYSGFQFDFYRKKYKFITLSAHPFFLESMAYFTLKVAFYVATFLVTFLYKFQHFLHKFQHFSYELQHFCINFEIFLYKFQHFLFILTIFLWIIILTNFQSLFLCSIYYVEIVFYIISRLICFLRSIMAVSCCHRCIYW